MGTKLKITLSFQAFMLPIFVFALHSRRTEGIPHKHLLKANSSIVITQVQLDGNSQVTTYISNNFKKSISPYSQPVALPSPVQPTDEPDAGNIVFYERIAYCFSGTAKSPVLVHVNQTEERVVTSEMDPIGQVESCRQMTTADIDGDGSNELVVVSVDQESNTVSVVVFEYVNNSPVETKEVNRVHLNEANKGMVFRITSGNFNQDTDGHATEQQIAVASYDQTSVRLWVLAKTRSQFGVLAVQTVADDLYSLYDPCVPMDSVVAYLRDDDGGGASTLIVAYQKDIVGSTVKIAIKSYQIKGNQLVEMYTTMSEVSPSAPPVNISLSTGQIRAASAQDTVVMSLGPYNGPFHIYALSATNGVLDGHTLWKYVGDEGTFAVAHQTNAAVLPQSDMIAVMDTYSTAAKLTEQKLHFLTVDGTSIKGEIVKTWTNSLYSYGYVTGGDFVGLNVFLGPETRYKATAISNVMTFLEAPPYHIQFGDDYDGNPSVTWTTSSSRSTTVTVKSSETWASSNSLKLSLVLFESSLSNSVTKQTQRMVEEEYERQVSVTRELKVGTIFDEALIVRRMSFDITEVPVYIGKKPSGHILIVQPMDKHTNTLFVTVGSRLYYNSSHVIGDVRTYPWNEPKNMNYSIYTVSGTVAVGLSFDHTVTSEVMIGKERALTREQTTAVENELDLSFPFEIGGISGSLGFSHSDSDSYGKTEVNTTQTQLTTRIEISLSLPGYSPNSGGHPLQYDIDPYIYWDFSGRLHISWAVRLPRNEWDNYISHPDPALLMPYMHFSDSPVIKNLLFELYTTPRGIPEDGSSVLISIIVHNYSFKPALNTTVEFYWTDTSRIPPKLHSENDKKEWYEIGNKTIVTIGGFSDESTFISWYPKKGCKSAIIIVKLGSSNPDFDEDNNLGYSVWPQDSNNPLKWKYLLEQSFAFNGRDYKDELSDIGAVAADLLFKRCSGLNIGQYYHQHNCFKKNGKCCSLTADGTGSSCKATNDSRAFCGYCFTGQLQYDTQENEGQEADSCFIGG